MQSTKKFFVALIVALFVFSTPITGQAGTTTLTGVVKNVTQVVSGGTVISSIVITPSGATTNRYFVLPTSAVNTMMAVALTAIASQKSVTCGVDTGNLVSLAILD